MALQLILGPSGAGKSEYIYDKIIRRTMEDEHCNYIVLVPEQYSLEIQRKLVKKHPRGGSFQIDVIGFTRLAYRLFDELHIRPTKVLEDFGKSMLLRLAAEEKKDELSLYAGSLSKMGFIDEVKSLMSELYQYDVPRERLLEAVKQMDASGEDGVLARKLKDMIQIFETFEEKKGKNFIVAEQMLELLAQAAERSRLIAESDIVLDGFTGFTPIQMNLISVLLRRAKSVTVLLTIDEKSYKKKALAEHELFALTKQTIDRLLVAAEREQVVVEDIMFLGADGCRRWKKDHPLAHLEQNLFRYPYREWRADISDLQITVYDNPVQELAGVAAQIRELVIKQGYRYREIAVVSGNLEETADVCDRVFPMYGIPYFIDMVKPVRNHPCVEALTHAFRVVEENFSYDSVFSFLKSGVVRELEQEETEQLENYVLARGRKGYRSWSQTFKNGEDTSMEQYRSVVMDVLKPVYKALSGKKKKIAACADAMLQWMDQLGFADQFQGDDLYEKVRAIFDKMQEIMPEELVDATEFAELFAVGMKDVSLGVIPSKLDMLVVGDITRTRLADIRILFIVGVNDGVIPKRAGRCQIINDREKERLQALGVDLAPTEQANSYTEQFYLYQNMTKPSDGLRLSYVNLNLSNDTMRPSYILERIRRIFPKLSVKRGADAAGMFETRQSGIEMLVMGMQELLAGDMTHKERTLQMYKLYLDIGDTELLDRITRAMRYKNIPDQLTKEAAQLIRLRDMSMSVSKLEQYAKCAYAFYLRYILRLSERQVHGIENRNIGIILHEAMEKLFACVRDERANQWDTLEDAWRDAKTEECVRQSFEKEYEGQEIDEGQYVVLLNSLVRVGKRTVRNLQALMTDDYRPRFLEYKFRKTISADGEEFDLRGVVDRSDIYVDEADKTIRLRVIDYKSGEHRFDIGKVYDGLELQLAMYTGVMTALVQEAYNDGALQEYRVLAEGMYYYHMQDPYVEAETIDAAEQARNKKLVYAGISREDVDDFDTIIEYADYKAGMLAAQIKAGEIAKNPKREGQTTTCDYCAYKDVCRFDEKYGQNHFQSVKRSAEEKELVLREMQKLCHGQKNRKK